MTDHDSEPRVEDFVRQSAGTASRLRADKTWLTVHPDGAPLPEQGWKLHVSSRVATFPALVEKLLPVLLAEGCVFKLARSTTVLARLNDGISSPAAVGKAFTVYPDGARVQEIGLRLAALLRGEQGPRILSDRRVAPDAPVYYRYGPFVSPWAADSKGRLVTFVHGPDGEEFGALATLRYRQPAWAVDPFTGASGADLDAESALVLGNHYRLEAGVFQTGRGSVFRAVDQRDGTRVVVKQARALVDEHAVSGDVRLKLRNERRVLQALDGVPGVARFIDHFRHGADEYLVTADAGPYDLADDVMHHGRYAPGDGGGERSLELLGSRLAGILLDLHARGVVVRDLKPKNVVVDGQEVTLIDLGLASFDGFNPKGGTPGYASLRQTRDEPPSPADDLHALGMTLAFASQGLPVVTVGEDPDTARRRALQVIQRDYGDAPNGIMGLIADLLTLDEATMTESARRLAAGQTPAGTASPRRLPRPPVVTGSLLAEIVGNLRTDLADQSRRVLTAPASRSIAHDASVYSGSAGIGLELLEHADTSDVADVLKELVPFTLHAMTAVDLPPGLLVGRTGVDVFLQRARAAGFEAGAGYAASPLPGPDWKPESDDMIIGAAGVGLGHLLLHDLEGGSRHLDIARRCAESVMEHPPLDATILPTALPERAAVEPSAGRAHGLAGTVELLAFVGDRIGDDAMLAVAAERARILTGRANVLAERIRTRYAAPLAASWCQGLTGMAQSLLYAGEILGEPSFTAAARHIGDACATFLPRVAVASQCCGAAGIGNMLINLAVHESSEKYWDAANAAAVQMLLRSSGSDGHPVFVEDDPEDNSASWAFGIAGILAFFRRLSQQGGNTGLPLPHVTGRAGSVRGLTAQR